MPQSQLKISNLRVSYSSQVVLDGVSLTIHAGEVHGILGGNGAGKTTLFRAVYDMLPADNGQITLQGFDGENKKIAYLETEPTFYPFMKGIEYLELLSAQNQSFNPADWNALFRLPLDDYVDTYSTGMKKKLAILGILAVDRPVMLLDEPHTGLDLQSVHMLDRILAALKEKGKLIVMTSHIMEVLKKNCNRISLLHNRAIQSTYGNDEFEAMQEEVETLFEGYAEPILKVLLQDSEAAV